MCDEPNLRLVKKLENLLEKHLDKNEKIEKLVTKRLTAPGENYGSLMLSLEILIKNTKTNQEKTLNLVGKTLQENEVFQKVFNVQTTFKNEIGFYTTVFPALDEFLKSVDKNKGVDFVPKCFGGRINLDGNCEKVDEDACLLLENLKILGYSTLPKKVGFNLECAKYALEALAKLHGTSLAFKLKEPEKFDKFVKPYLSDFFMSEEMSLAAGLALKQVMEKYNFPTEFINRATATYEQNVNKKINKRPSEPWSCIMHNDFWTNNILLKIDPTSQKPQNVLLCDFQISEYKSPARDVLFFLFTSVQVDVIKQHLDELLKFYHQRLIQELDRLGIDIDKFSWENFLVELRCASVEAEFSHILMMLQPIFREAKPEMNLEYRKNPALLYPVPSGTHLERMLCCIEEFEKKGWLLP